MVCIDAKRIGYASVIFALLLFTGCATKKAKETTGEAGGAEDGTIELIANPYLAQEIKVPALAENQFRTATVLMQGENWRAAEQLLQEMTVAYPELAGPWVNLGITRRRQNNLEAAEQAFEKALQINPLHNDAYVQWAIMAREQGEFDKAEQLYLKALEVWPHNLTALRNLGILYDLYMGKFEQALAQYELALRLMPEPSQEMQGWIIDLKRRMAARAEGE